MDGEDRKEARRMLTTAGILLAVGTTSAFVLISGAVRGTAGARLSTRLQWEERKIELDQAVSQAEAEGKLRTPRPDDDPSHE